MKKKLIFFSMIIILCSGLIVTGKGLYIPLKAFIAQILLENSWEKMTKGEIPSKPWPWADFWPVARLSFPRQHFRTIVVNSASGTSLAFAPGHLDGSTAPGQEGNCVIIGHRETHFTILRDVIPGDTIQLTCINGTIIDYSITDVMIINKTDRAVTNQTTETQLTLITCYPFNSLFPGNKRFVAIAKVKKTSRSIKLSPTKRRLAPMESMMEGCIYTSNPE
ncbi:MAG: class GN sortase [Spirochaetales bacterium]|nr:class GN sortase [Spirochaetales bacterium]